MPVRVLLADPDESLLKRYREFLAQLGFDVATATNGVDCLYKLRRFAPSLLVLEPQLPWGWGDGVLSVLEDGADGADGADGRHTPVLILSAEKETGEALRKAGYRISATEVKPLEPYFLANRILRILLESQAAGPRREPANA